MADHNYALMCDSTALCRIADVAKVQSGEPFRNAIVRYHAIRIQVLDYRSCRPVAEAPVARLWIGDKDGGNKELVARYVAHDKAWDVEKNLPIYPHGGSWYCGPSSASSSNKGLVKASQIAINALGFDTGVPGSAYGQQGKTAWMRYRLEHGMLKMSAHDIATLGLNTPDTKKIDPAHLNDAGTELKSTFKDKSGAAVSFSAPNDEQMKGIIARYNTRCYRAAQFHLAASGFYPGTDNPLEDFALDEHESGDWTEDWKKAFDRWCKANRVTPNKPFITTASEGAKLKSTHKPFVTDVNGIVTVPIPKHIIPDGFSIEIEFLDFPVVGEALADERNSSSTAVVWRASTLAPVELVEEGYPAWTVHSPNRLSRMRMRWTGTQSSDRLGKWGWEMEHDGDTPSVTQKREFQTSWEFRVPAFDYGESITWGKLHEATQALSAFYDPPRGTPEFVLFAMQWCQGAYYELPASVEYLIEGSSAETPASERGDLATTEMRAMTRPDHPPTFQMCTRCIQPSQKGGGRDFGMYFPTPSAWSGNVTPRGADDKHTGCDLAGRDGITPVFAMTGGRLERYYVSTGGYGHCIIQATSYRSDRFIRYAHLANGTVLVNGGAQFVASATSTIHLKAGQWLGNEERTFNGNAAYPSVTPTHVHIEVQSSASTGGAKTRHRTIFNGGDPHRDANLHLIPDNSMIRLFPCDSPDAKDDEGKNPANCAIRSGGTEAGIAKKCWALRELCCPYMPQTIDVGTLEEAAHANHRRRVQAQLKQLFTKNAGASNPYVDPGAPDGAFGAAPDKATIAEAGVTLRESAGDGAGTAFTPNKVTTANQKVTLIAAEGTWRKIQLDDGAIAWIPHTKVSGTFPSSTRRAIKALHDKVSTDAGTPLKQAPACFKLDAATLKHLNDNAPIHKPRPKA